MFVLDICSEYVHKFSNDGADGGIWGAWESPGGPNFVVDIAVDRDGNVYVLDDQDPFGSSGRGDKVLKFSNDGNFITSIGNDGRMYFPANIKLDSRGNVFVGNVGYIVEYNSAGAFVTRFDASCSGQSDCSPTLRYIDDLDHILINHGSLSDPGIDVYDSSGTLLDVYTSWIDGFPASDGAGHLFTVEYGTAVGDSRVGRYTCN